MTVNKSTVTFGFGGSYARIFRIGIFTAAATILTLPLSANLLTPGSTVTPDVFTNGSGLVMLASTGTQTVDPVPGNSFNATYTEYVYADNSGTGLCAGCLDFFILLTNSGPGIIEDITSSLNPGFTGFTVDAGYNTAGIPGGPSAPAGAIAPTAVNRSGNSGPTNNGSVVDFQFKPGSNLQAGQTTALLEIETNALFFIPGTVSVQDGVSGFAAGFMPTSTPEPASFALFGLGLIGIGVAKFRRAHAKG